jgi:hypothetical protein
MGYLDRLHGLRIGDRVTLKEEYDAPGQPEYAKQPQRDSAFGPHAKHAVGTITVLDYLGTTVGVIWDDPSMIDSMYRTSDCQWAPGWFNIVGHMTFDNITDIENYLNGRSNNHGSDQHSR